MRKEDVLGMLIVLAVICACGCFLIFSHGCQMEKCAKACGDKVPQLDRNIHGSDKCYCIEKNGELKLKTIL